ncbi:aldo/keto reductase [Christensenella tenuis]|jgi:aryl-alcohol dehydrogenase-like predicted oxidoreductase|uniref:Aldo/keto reductase n=1 Tax=Christensenella tenuis TaxID=2763033 RepID=A0ABR7EH13_9FIRM|nr:aldo/keto reductase [Christensenella tenuis]MBC5648651.1 aldo/keto reductase [Christensenella tenuis]
MMEYVKLGRTDLNVSRMVMGGDVRTSREEFAAALQLAVDRGVNLIDTAPAYGNSEAVLGTILPEIKGELFVSTKFSNDPQPFLPQDRDCLMRAVENSLNRLKRDKIDIWMVHEPDRPYQYDWWKRPQDLNHPEEYYGPVMDVLSDLKSQGVIKYTGIGGTTAYEIVPIIESGFFDVILTAFNYSLLWQEAAIEVIPAAKKQNMGILLGSALQQGALAKRYDEQVKAKPAWLSKPRQQQYLKLYELCDDLGMDVADLAMRFAFSNPDIHAVVTGAGKVRNVERNLASYDKGPLPEDILKRIDEIYQMVPFRPFEESFFMPFTRPYKGPRAVH